eukprot:TRINITY_DN8985_c0_g1_i5.p1 TRINITY_DN8985_c0_g1~~TRINITY_DN8985_c0_g1_i5.p1  ORF type:complete len:576 (+),score=49.80 TRINITY_DN8985_c0_g1_i5:235-1728(+)
MAQQTIVYVIARSSVGTIECKGYFVRGLQNDDSNSFSTQQDAGISGFDQWAAEFLPQTAKCSRLKEFAALQNIRDSKRIVQQNISLSQEEFLSVERELNYNYNHSPMIDIDELLQGNLFVESQEEDINKDKTMDYIQFSYEDPVENRLQESDIVADDDINMQEEEEKECQQDQSITHLELPSQGLIVDEIFLVQNKSQEKTKESPQIKQTKSLQKLVTNDNFFDEFFSVLKPQQVASQDQYTQNYRNYTSPKSTWSSADIVTFYKDQGRTYQKLVIKDDIGCATRPSKVLSAHEQISYEKEENKYFQQQQLAQGFCESNETMELGQEANDLGVQQTNIEEKDITLGEDNEMSNLSLSNDDWYGYFSPNHLYDQDDSGIVVENDEEQSYYRCRRGVVGGGNSYNSSLEHNFYNNEYAVGERSVSGRRYKLGPVRFSNQFRRYYRFLDDDNYSLDCCPHMFRRKDIRRPFSRSHDIVSFSPVVSHGRFELVSSENKSNN